MKNIRETEIRKEFDNIHRVWAEVSLDILEKWTTNNWKIFNKHKDTYFLHPYKWVIIATGKTEKEAEDNAKNVVSRYRN